MTPTHIATYRLCKKFKNIFNFLLCKVSHTHIYPQNLDRLHIALTHYQHFQLHKAFSINFPHISTHPLENLKLNLGERVCVCACECVCCVHVDICTCVCRCMCTETRGQPQLSSLIISLTQDLPLHLELPSSAVLAS